MMSYDYVIYSVHDRYENPFHDIVDPDIAQNQWYLEQITNPLKDQQRVKGRSLMI